VNEEKCILYPERDCIGKAAAIKLEARIENLERWKDSSHEFHEKFYRWQREQDIKSAKLDERLKSMDANLMKVVAYQEEHQKKPAKRWDAIVEKSIWAVLAAVIAYVLARVGF
jgi:hypothetical protein